MFKKLFIILFKTIIGWIVSIFVLAIFLTGIIAENEAGEIVLSDNGGGLISIFILLSFFGVPAWAIISTLKKGDSNASFKKSIKKPKKKVLPPREAHLNRLFQRHKEQLARNFNRTIVPNEYGAIDTKSVDRWHNEIIRFLNSVNLPEYLFKKDRHFDEAINYINQLTQIYINELDSQSDNSVNFENITDSHEYELACAKELEIHGWQALVSPIGADQGIDVRANKEGLHVIIQCKLYSSSVGNKAVQEALSGKLFDKADFAVVVAPNGFTRSAMDLARSTGVLLLSHNDLKNLSELISSN